MHLLAIAEVLILASAVAWLGSRLYLRLCATVPPENRLTLVRWLVVLPVTGVVVLVVRPGGGLELVDLVDFAKVFLQQGPGG